MSNRKILITNLIYIILLFIFICLYYGDVYAYICGEYFAKSDEDSVIFGFLFFPVWFSGLLIISQKLTVYKLETIRYKTWNDWWINIQKNYIGIIILVYLALFLLVYFTNKNQDSFRWEKLVALIINAILIGEIQMLLGLLTEQILIVTLFIAFMEGITGKIQMQYSFNLYKNVFTWWTISINETDNHIDLIIFVLEIVVIICIIMAMHVNFIKRIIRGHNYGND